MFRIASLFLVLTVCHLTADENWTRFRGENGRGLSQSTLPDTLNKNNLAWSIDLKGNGSSSPVIYKNKLFIKSKNLHSN